VPRCFGGGDYVAVVLNAGVADEYVDDAVFGDGGLDGGVGVCRFAYVAWKEIAVSAGLGDVGSGAGGGFGVDVKDGDGGALCGEFAGGSFADAHRAAGHDGDLIFEFKIHEIDFRVSLSSSITILAAW